tara:strand:+ start:4660 stop:5289 length:630 start_codon:yes stop_codon:yes gene_type:complete
MEFKKYDKNYDTAADRLKVFYDKYPDHKIVTELLNHYLTPDGKYQVEFLALIKKGEETIASGHALEREGSSDINKTSWYENCETSAIGRALKTLGIGDAGNFASKEEVTNATDKKKVVQKSEKVAKGKKLTTRAKKNTKALDLSFITDDRTDLSKMANSFKMIGITKAILTIPFKNYDKEGKYSNIANFLAMCPTDELKRFILEDVVKK